jgi:ketosteroid isomerase-like protein
MRRVLGPLLTLCLLIPMALSAAPAKKPPSTAKTVVKRANPDAFKTPLQSLVAAEEGFAKMAAEKNVRDAFIANLAEDCVMFRPLPVNGLEAYRSRPVTADRLAWKPTYAEVAASGNFGVTTGPWEFTPADSQPHPEVSYGQFLSVWRRDTAKGWKVALDCGISHSKPDTALANAAFFAGPEHPAADPGTPPEVDLLLGLDRAFSRMALNLNPSRAVVYWTTNDLRFLREGDAPRLGDDARNAMGGLRGHAQWRPTAGGIAPSGDLGFTYGVREDSTDVAGQAPDTTVYVHVWRLGAGDKWRMSAVVDNPLRRK